MPAILEDQDGVQHACEAETSMMMVVAPETVRREALAEAHGPAHVHRRPLALGALSVVPRLHPRRAWSAMPGAPTREKGEKLLAACATALVATLEDPQTWD